jgi:hypothetical protein
MSAPTDRRKPSPTVQKRSAWVTVLVVALLVGYVLARPHLERRFGVELPDLIGQGDAPPEPQQRQDDPARVPGSGASTRDSERSRGTSTPSTPSDDVRQTARDSASATGDAALAGGLRDVGHGVYESPAGLRYRPGSEEGHRLEHVLRHAEDDPDRPGPHGVFDGDQAAIVAVLDEAYRKAQAGGRGVRTEEEDGRTIYTVDLGRRIGYVGGRDGARQRHPAATHVRMVLDGADVITAFPLRP